jgi:4'-phosphopantetheinyl transferase
MFSLWRSVDVLPPLETREVQLWRIELDNASDLIGHYTSHLTSFEKADAGRRRAGETRNHFAIGRACLRILLGHTLGIAPHDISLRAGEHGKLEIGGSVGKKLSFNVAHSNNTILIAIGYRDAIGVDVEYLDRTTDLMEVAHANFTRGEIAALEAAVSPEIRRKTFYTYWTRKEAVGKADGRGLLISLASLDVSLGSMSNNSVRLLNSDNDGSKEYFVSDIDLGNRSVGALALDSPDCDIFQLLFPLASKL